MKLISQIKRDLAPEFFKLRHQKKLTIYEVARATNLTPEQIDAIELNYSEARYSLYRTLAKFYNKKISVRLEDKENEL